MPPLPNRHVHSLVQRLQFRGFLGKEPLGLEVIEKALDVIMLCFDVCAIRV